MASGNDNDDDDDDKTRIGGPLPVPPASSDADDTPPAEENAPTPPEPDSPQDTHDDDVTRLAPLSTPPKKPPQDPAAESEATRIATTPPTSRDEGGEATDLPPLPQPKTAAILPGTTTTTRIEVGVGTLINNNYEIKEVLKSGGMGEVYRGVELGTGDPVAIKVILPELAEDEKAGLMFKREARTLRQLSDEAIVRYYNYVHDREIDRYCLIMEFISGVPLSDHTEAHGPISPAAGRTLLDRLARGLRKAHMQEVIHRDLSPDNVMLPDGLVSEAVLIDFGIAKSNVVKESTMAGQFAGKFKYVSPEQLGHYGGEIGPQTDVYGLALLMCAALIGKPLDMGSSIVEAVQSRQSIPDLSDVPAEFRPLLSHMLEPDPTDRPADMQLVRDMLENPALIPPKYCEGMSLPPGLMTPPGVVTNAGLAVPPTSISPGMTGGTMPPFPRQSTMPPEALPEPEQPGGGARVLTLLALAFVLVLGGVGYFAWTQDMIPGVTATTSTTPATGGGASVSSSGGLPSRNTSTREGFLAEFDIGECSYVSRVPSGPNAGMLAAISPGGDGFAGLPVSYEEAFGARPAIMSQRVSEAQCPVLDFARALQGRTDRPVQISFGTDSLYSGESVAADIRDGGADSLWAVLISPQGQVYNLTDRLSESAGGRRTMRFGLTLNTGRDPVPQLILLVATTEPLVSVAAARAGADAGQLLPKVLTEISERGGYVSADLVHLELRPTPAEGTSESQSGTASE
ncbi:MAG: protein kinase [Roseovarius sp.]